MMDGAHVPSCCGDPASPRGVQSVTSPSRAPVQGLRFPAVGCLGSEAASLELTGHLGPKLAVPKPRRESTTGINSIGHNCENGPHLFSPGPLAPSSCPELLPLPLPQLYHHEA